MRSKYPSPHTQEPYHGSTSLRDDGEEEARGGPSGEAGVSNTWSESLLDHQLLHMAKLLPGITVIFSRYAVVLKILPI